MSTLERFQHHGVMKVTLAGGEPLYHSRILQILEEVRALDIDLSLITNATLMTETVADAIAKTPNLRSVTASLDGATPEENDAVRGRGVFERTVAGVRLLRQRYDRKLTLRMTVMRSNFPSIRQMPALLGELGIQELKINRLNPYGRAAGRSDLLLSDDEYRRARDQLYENAIRFGVRMEVPSFKYQIDKDGLIGLCRAGEETCEVDADGSVFPCSFAGGRFLAGTVKDHTFTDILRNLQMHSINNDYCYSCRGRGGAGEKPIGFVPHLVQLSRPKTKERIEPPVARPGR
jgi:MoaA/NifB/PqqE/SkfB family radical SAM enzyme